LRFRREELLFEKSSKKPLDIGGRVVTGAGSNNQKLFGSFVQKRTY
jgi:hypothetical protein